MPLFSRFCSAVIILVTCVRVLQAGSTTYTMPGGAVENWTVAAWGMSGGDALLSYPSRAGDIAAASNNPAAVNMNTLDANVTVGQLYAYGTANNTNWVIVSDGSHYFTMDNIGGSKNIFGSLNSFIGETGANNLDNRIIVNPDVLIANGRALDVGFNGPWGSGQYLVTVNGKVRGANANVTLRPLGNTHKLAVGELDVSGSVAVENSAGPAVISIGSIGSNVARFIVSNNSDVPLVGINSNSSYFAGQTVVTRGVLGLNGAGVTLANSDVIVKGGRESSACATLFIDRSSASAPQSLTAMKSLTLTGSGGLMWMVWLSGYTHGLFVKGGNANTTLDRISDALTIGDGHSEITFINNNEVLAANNFARQGRGTVYFSANGLGTGPADTSHNNVTFAVAPTGQMIGAGGSYSSTTASILPWAVIADSPCTYGPDGLTAAGSLRNNLTASLPAENNYVDTSTQTLVSDLTINSLRIKTGSIKGAYKLTVTSGAIVGSWGNSYISDGTLDFGPVEGIIHLISGTTLAVSNAVTGTDGLTVSLGVPQTGNPVATLALYSTANNIAGQITVNAVTLLLGASGVLKGVNASAGDVAIYGGTLDLGANNDTVGQVMLDQSGVITGSGDATLTSAGGYKLCYGSVYANLAGTVGLTKTGTALVTIYSTNNTYSGTTEVVGGSLSLWGGTNARLNASSPLQFSGAGGAFNYDNSIAMAGCTQFLGQLSFAGGDGLVQVTRFAAQPILLSFSSLAARTPGAVGKFMNGNWFQGDGNVYSSSGCGTIGTDSKIAIAGQSAGFMGQGCFFCSQGGGGPKTVSGDFAWYDAVGYVRGINYGTDANTVSVGAGATVGENPNKFVKVTGAITAQTNITVNTLNLSGANNLTLADGETLTLAVGGLLKAGDSGYGTISGGAGIRAGNNTELVVRVDGPGDGLIINTPILANGTNMVTICGSGTLVLGSTNTYTGETVINGGTVIVTNALALQNSVLNLAGGTVSFGVTNPVIGGLKGSRELQIGGIALTIASGQNTSFSGSFFGNGSVVKGGTGTLAMASANLCKNTTVTNGVIYLQGNLVCSTGAVLGVGGMGRVVVNGDLSMSAGSVNRFDFDGSAFGGITVTGSVNLASATLSVGVVQGKAPPANIMLINNDGSDAINGTWAGVADNSMVNVGIYRYRINYHGGDGNDVTLIRAFEGTLMLIR